MKRRWVVLAGLAAVVLPVIALRQEPGGIDPLPDSEVETTKVFEGVTYKLDYQGRAYRVDERANKWRFHAAVLDVAGMTAAYETENGVTRRTAPDTGERFATVRQLREDFEGLAMGVDGLREMIGPARGWGSLTLQSPQFPSVGEYVALRRRILEEGHGFEDASIAPDSARSHGGGRSLKCVAPPPTGDMITSKSSVSCPLVYFRKGDDFWYRAFYYAESARPMAIMDLECEWLEHQGGIRLCIDQTGRLMGELKALDKPTFRQPNDAAVLFPLNQWVEVQAHFQLSDGADGVVQIWQDGQLLVDARGVTLPLPRVIYSSLEVGISAHSYGDQTALLWVDDIEVSDKAFP